MGLIRNVLMRLVRVILLRLVRVVRLSVRVLFGLLDVCGIPVGVHLRGVVVVSASRVFIIAVRLRVGLRLAMDVNTSCGRGVVSAILAHRHLFLVLIIKPGSVAGGSCGRRSSGRDIAVKSLSAASLEQEPNARQERGRYAQADDDKDTSDGSSVSEEAGVGRCSIGAGA